MAHKGSHIKSDGTLGECRALPGNCPIKATALGEQYHGTYEEVSAEIERRHEETYGPLGVSLPEPVMTVTKYGDKD